MSDIKWYDVCNNATLIIFAVVNPHRCTFVLEYLGGERSETTTILTQGCCENTSAAAEMIEVDIREN